MAGAGPGGSPIDDEIDWDDPATVKVHYDLRSWGPDARGDLIAALASGGIVHRWEADEIVVAEVAESATDEIIDRIESEHGPFAVVLDGPGVTFALDEFGERDLGVMAATLVEAGIAHRWDGATVVVESSAADDVDDLVDAIERGDIAVEPGADDEVDDIADTVLSDLFSIADRLRRDPTDTTALRRVTGLVAVIDPDRPPFGITLRSWSVIVTAATAVVDAFDEYEAETVTAAAEELRSLLRPFV